MQKGHYLEFSCIHCEKPVTFSVFYLDSENPTVAVQPDFELIAFDFVSNPSTQGAFMSPGRMNEGVKKLPSCRKNCKIETIINNILRGE